MKKGALLVLILLVLTALLPVGSKLLEGKGQLLIGRTALKSGAIRDGIYALGRASRAVTPLSPFPEEAASTLMLLGERFEREEKPQLALLAYSTLRESLIGSRLIFDMRAGLLEKVNRRLSRLYAGIDGTQWPDPSLTPPEREAVAFSRLTSSHGPSQWLAFLGGLAFLGWVGGAILGIRHGFLEDGTLVAKPAMVYGTVTALSLAVFFMAMRLA